MSIDLRNCNVVRTHRKHQQTTTTTDQDNSFFPLLSYPSSSSTPSPSLASSAMLNSAKFSSNSSFASIVITTNVGSTIFIQENSEGVFWYENLRKVRVASDPMNDVYVERVVRIRVYFFSFFFHQPSRAQVFSIFSEIFFVYTC